MPLAHPLDGGRVAVLHRSVDDTADGLGADANAYRRLLRPFVEAGFELTDGLLQPISSREHPVRLARFGWSGFCRRHRGLARVRGRRSAGAVRRTRRALVSACGLRPRRRTDWYWACSATSSAGRWPGVARNKSQTPSWGSSSSAGVVECDRRVSSLTDTAGRASDSRPHAAPGTRSPVIQHRRYRKALRRFRYGPGVVKVDWVLDGPVPWTNPLCTGGHGASRWHVRRDRQGRGGCRRSPIPIGRTC